MSLNNDSPSCAFTGIATRKDEKSAGPAGSLLRPTLSRSVGGVSEPTQKPGGYNSGSDAVGEEYVLVRKTSLPIAIPQPVVKGVESVGRAQNCTVPSSNAVTFVKTDQDEKGVPKPSSLLLGALLKSQMGRVGARLRPLRTKIAFAISQVSAAGAALAFSVPVSPQSSAEFSSFLSLFDEVKVFGGVANFAVTSGSGGTSVLQRGVIVLDPTTQTPLTSVEDGAVFSKHQLFNLPGVGLGVVAPTALSSHGMWSWQWETPAGVALASANSSVMGNQYASTADTVDSWGFLKFFLSAGGGTALTTVQGTIVLDVGFRSRQ